MEEEGKEGGSETWWDTALNCDIGEAWVGGALRLHPRWER